MRRRSLVLLAAACALTGCTSKQPVALDSSPRPAVADDYWWFALERDLSKGFCFTWVRGLVPRQVLSRIGGEELERVGWQQLVGSGDGQRGPADRYFIGVTGAGDWSLIVEDRSDLGVTDRLVLPLSAGTRVVSHHRAADGHGRFLLVEDGVVQLDFDPAAPAGPGKLAGTRAGELAPMLTAAGVGADPSLSVEATFALAERFTGISMTQDLLRTSTYLFTTVPRGPC